MAGENFDLDISQMIGEVGQPVSINEETNEVLEELKEKKDNKEDAKDDDLVLNEKGEAILYKDLKKEKEKNDEQPIKTVQQEEKKVPSSKNDTSSPYSPYAVTLKDEGILPDLDMDKFNGLKKEEQAQALVDAYKEQIENGKKQFIESLPETLRDLAQAVKEYGEHVPLMNLIQNRSEMMELSQVTDEDLDDNPELQEQLVIYHLKETTKYSDDKIKKEVAKHKASNTLLEEAKEAKPVLEELRKEKDKELIEKAKNDKIAENKERDSIIKNINEFVDKTDEYFPGKKISSEQKKELKKFMTEPIAYTKSGAPVSKVMEVRSKDPILFDARLYHYIQLGLFNEKVDTTKIESPIVTKGVKKLADIIEKNNAFMPKSDTLEEGDSETKEVGKKTISGITSFLDTQR